MVKPPEQWVRWGLVKEDVLWTLDKAVYGLRKTPALWSAERDKQLLKLEWCVGKKTYYLRRCASDSQVWILSEKASTKLLGTMIVYVDDFLLQTELGPMRDAFLGAIGEVWILEKEKILELECSITFLGIEIYMRKNMSLIHI